MFHDIMGFERALPWLATAFAAGYLIGSIPFGVLVARIFGLGNLREIGSGSIGATNVLRTGSKVAAALTLLLDAAKGAVPVLIFSAWGPLPEQLAGGGALIGHCFPVWLWFRGGKGVATGAGALLALSPVAGLIAAAAWLAAAALSRRSSVGALVATAVAPVALVALARWDAVLIVALMSVLIWVRHHANIRRLIAGTEPRIGQRG